MNKEEMLNKVICGDCLEKLKDLEDNSVDSIVTDPPYHLVSIVKRFGKEGSAPAKEGKDGSFKRLSCGFMGKTWDGVDENGKGIAYNVDMWKECLRVLKPGGHLLAFGGTRTYHRMACAIEDAGFEVRDMIEWVYGSGFPKSLNIGKAVDKIQGNKREVVGKGLHSNIHSFADETKYSGTDFKPDITKGTSEWEGWGTALKPAHEPICMARKPLAEKTVAENCLKYGTGGINIDESRVGVGAKKWSEPKGGIWNESVDNGATLEDNPLGRFPANLILEDCEEVRECFPDLGRSSKLGNNCKSTGGWSTGLKMSEKGKTNDYSDSGNASRFFKSIIYQAKASKSERNKGCEGLEEKNIKLNTAKYYTCKLCGKQKFSGSPCICENPEWEVKELKTTSKNNHPTVKPIALMEYLIKMVTPKGGIVLDPFAGSGSTLVAAKQNGFQYIGIELTEEYIPIIEARLNTLKQDKLL
jgi:site-specific DNA-methyltransferase (adenine-specific)